MLAVISQVAWVAGCIVKLSRAETLSLNGPDIE